MKNKNRIKALGLAVGAQGLVIILLLIELGRIPNIIPEIIIILSFIYFLTYIFNGK